MEDWIGDLQKFNPVTRKGDFEVLDKDYWRSGWKHTEESKAQMSKNMKGRTPWNKGKTGLWNHTDEAKEKCRIAGKKNPGDKKPRSKESNKKRSEALKQYYAARRAAGHKR